MNVRHPESDDELRAVVRVNRRAWLAACDVLPESAMAAVAEGPPGEELAARVASMREDRENLLVAVGEREGVVGYANVRRDPDVTKEFVAPDEAGRKERYVDPDHWSEGVGTAPLSAAVDRAGDARALVLETLSDNDPARGFYEALGFERTGESEFEVAGEPVPTVVYTREL